MVSRSGRPAATRLPKTMTRMAIVTGHDSISERSMAERLASLKLAHSALSPVRVTETPGRDSCWSGPSREPAAFTMALGSAPAPAVTMAVRPFLESEAPGCGGATVETSGLDSSVPITRAWTWRATGSALIGACRSTITTCRAVAPSPEKSRWTMVHACTDWLVESSQPAPASACSTRTAKNPNVPSTTSQTSTTTRRWVAVQAPSRAREPRCDAGTEPPFSPAPPICVPVCSIVDVTLASSLIPHGVSYTCWSDTGRGICWDCAGGAGTR